MNVQVCRRGAAPGRHFFTDMAVSFSLRDAIVSKPLLQYSLFTVFYYLSIFIN